MFLYYTVLWKQLWQFTSLGDSDNVQNPSAWGFGLVFVRFAHTTQLNQINGSETANSITFCLNFRPKRNVDQVYRLDLFCGRNILYLMYIVISVGSAVNDNTDFDAFGEKKYALHREIIS